MDLEAEPGRHDRRKVTRVVILRRDDANVLLLAWAWPTGQGSLRLLSGSSQDTRWSPLQL